MPSRWSLHYEQPSGVTNSADATFLEMLRWRECVVTLRRRAPHGWQVRIPRTGDHHLTDFVAGREMRLKRDGVWWSPGAGFMDAPSLPGGHAGQEIVLPGWGNAYALTLDHNTPFHGYAGVVLAATWDADSAIGNFLNEVDHYGTTNWFPSGGRTIGTAGTSFTTARNFSNMSPLEAILQCADIEGWSVRCGIDSSGQFTFTASGTVDQDLTGTIHLFDGAPGVALVDYQADGHAIAGRAIVVCRTPDVRTNLNGAHGAGATTITVGTTAGLQTNDFVSIGLGTTNLEAKQITVTSATQFTCSALSNSHSSGERVETLTDQRYRLTTRNAAASVDEAHHVQTYVIYNDSLVSATMRETTGDAYLAAYDHPLVRATYRVTDQAQIERMLDAGLEPGDSIKATSDDPELRLVYSNTTAVVQEMVVTLREGVCQQIDVVLGDPALDDYATLERSLAAMRAASTQVFA